MGAAQRDAQRDISGVMLKNKLRILAALRRMHPHLADSVTELTYKGDEERGPALNPEVVVMAMPVEEDEGE